MFPDKLVGDVVEQSGLLVGLFAFTIDIVEEDGKGAHAGSVHLLEFVHHVEAVGIIPLDVVARVNGPDKLHLVFGRFGHEFLNDG